MNNKQKGNDFERKMCEIIAQDGWWVHFMSPDSRGAQPFDIIAVRDGVPVAIDCKTCEERYFRTSRLEPNQVYAFRKWMGCGNQLAYLAVLHDSKIYMVYYKTLIEKGSVCLDEMEARWHINA